jgi:hypothetical protein
MRTSGGKPAWETSKPPPDWGVVADSAGVLTACSVPRLGGAIKVCPAPDPFWVAERLVEGAKRPHDRIKRLATKRRGREVLVLECLSFILSVLHFEAYRFFRIG